MTTSMQITLLEPTHYDRAYDRDMGATQESTDTKEIATLALYIISMSPYLRAPVSVIMQGVRSYNSLSELTASLSNPDATDTPYQALQTLVSTASLAALFFGSPVGLLITTLNDFALEMQQLVVHLQADDREAALESALKVLNHSLYLALFATSSVELAIASIGIQIACNVYQAYKGANRGSNLACATHLIMAALGAYQMSNRFALMQLENQAKKPAEVDTVTSVNEKAPVNTFRVLHNTAQAKDSDYANAVRVERGISLEKAYEIANSDPGIDYFVYAKQGMMQFVGYQAPSTNPLNLITVDDEYGCALYYRVFKAGDVVFFKKEGIWFGPTEPRADTYMKPYK